MRQTNPMKKCMCLLTALMLLGTGCSKAESAAADPSYFAPLVQELENDWEQITLELPEVCRITRWCDEEWPWPGRFEENTYQAYYDGEWMPSFDLEELADSEEGDSGRNILGVYQEADSDHLYVCLNAFDSAGQEQTSQEAYQNDRIFLLEYSPSQPQSYQVTAVYEELPYSPGVNPYTYCLGGRIYISADYDQLMAIDLETKALSDCEAEYKAVNEYAREQFDRSAISFAAVYERDGITVYSGAVANNEELPATRGMVFVAFQDGEPVARMCADFTADDFEQGMKVTK